MDQEKGLNSKSERSVAIMQVENSYRVRGGFR